MTDDRPRYRQSIGGIEGWLSDATLTADGGLAVTLVHHLTGEEVPGYRPPPVDRRLVAAALAATHHRVLLRGRLWRDTAGTPVKVAVESIRQLRAAEHLPSIQDLGGSQPDFTGGLRSEDYVRQMRD